MTTLLRLWAAMLCQWQVGPLATSNDAAVLAIAQAGLAIHSMQVCCICTASMQLHAHSPSWRRVQHAAMNVDTSYVGYRAL
jgi:hypothetical protein